MSKDVSQPRFVRVAAAGEVKPGSSKICVVDGREIALFNVSGKYYAIENTCPHQGGPLGEGWLEGNIVTCPWHAWCFDVTTGKMTLGDYDGVEAFDVVSDGEGVSVSAAPRANGS
jgi:nitrite reductase/ring-hydroxylating ferredoxin subunit